MNYEEEVKKLSSGADWFRATTGVYSIKILSEPVEIEPYVDKDDPERKTPRIKLDIETNNKKFAWSISKATTKNSLYGQLMILGLCFGKLEGSKITLICNAEGKKTTYMIQEALPLMVRKDEDKNK